MKKLLILLVCGVVMPQFYGQTVADAVNYSNQNLTGSARYRGVSGAFGALGGDLSALNSNPAGSAVFTQSFASLSLTSDGYDNQTIYMDGAQSTSVNNVDLNQIGGVFTLESTGKIRKLSFGFNYDRASNYDNQFIARGRSNSSISEYFLGYAQGTPLSLLQLQNGETTDELYQYLGENENYSAQQAFLGYQGYLIDPSSEDANNTQYLNAQTGGNFNQNYRYLSFGNNSKFTLNGGAQVGDDLFLGVNLNLNTFNFTRNTLFSENTNDAANAVSSVNFDNIYRAFGAGVSAQVGGIYKFSQSLRVGLALDTPTLYTINEETEQFLRTQSDNGTVSLNPNVINIYQSYNLRTPGKATASLAYIFGSLGFLSFDYSYQDFSSIQYQPVADVFFQDLNTDIASDLKAVSTYKLGGEFLAGAWSFRGGYRFQESPYLNQNTLGSLTGYSVGLGYTLGNTRIDLAYDWSKQQQNPRLYDGAFTNTVLIDRVNTNLVASVSFQL